MKESKFTLLEKILPLIDKYVDGGGEIDASSFARWMALKGDSNPNPEVIDSAKFDPTELMNRSDPNGALSFYLVRLNKYAKYYLKDAFAGTPLKSGDDFGYIAALASVPSLTKSELIQMNVGETSGGMDIIRRLEREGVLETYTDENDKRAKRVRLTDRGKGVFFSVLPNMKRVGQIVKAHLGEEDVIHLVKILSTLDSFHKEIYNNEKEYKLDEIEDKYMK